MVEDRPVLLPLSIALWCLAVCRCLAYFVVLRTLGVLCKQSGFWAGIFMIALAAFLTHNSSMMLINAGEKTKRLNYEELMGEVFGSIGFHAFNLFAGVLSFGAMTAYLIIIGDTITRIAVASGTTGMLTDRESVIILFAVVIILPISALKDLSKLSYTSLASVLADIVLVTIVAFTGRAESR